MSYMYIYICGMSNEAFIPNTTRKLIDLPSKTADGLILLASKKGMKTKPYMEQVLIAHEKKKAKRKTGKLI